MIDYMVMEAIALKVQKEDEQRKKEAEEEAERKKWKEDLSELEAHR